MKEGKVTKINEKEISKYLSYILRHKPDSIGLNLDTNGWADIDEFIDKTKDFKLDKETIEKVVKNSDKQRFVIRGNKIRANQGHSIEVDLNLQAKEPPKILYHGTATRFLSPIVQKGLVPKDRQYVHLSHSKSTALEVGKRHGKPIVLEIDTIQMRKDGYNFLLSDNGVWLVSNVPIKYISH